MGVGDVQLLLFTVKGEAPWIIQLILPGNIQKNLVGSMRFAGLAQHSQRPWLIRHSLGRRIEDHYTVITLVGNVKALLGRIECDAVGGMPGSGR